MAICVEKMNQKGNPNEFTVLKSDVNSQSAQTHCWQSEIEFLENLFDKVCSKVMLFIQEQRIISKINCFLKLLNSGYICDERNFDVIFQCEELYTIDFASG